VVQVKFFFGGSSKSVQAFIELSEGLYSLYQLKDFSVVMGHLHQTILERHYSFRAEINLSVDSVRSLIKIHSRSIKTTEDRTFGANRESPIKCRVREVLEKHTVKPTFSVKFLQWKRKDPDKLLEAVLRCVAPASDVVLKESSQLAPGEDLDATTHEAYSGSHRISYLQSLR